VFDKTRRASVLLSTECGHLCGRALRAPLDDARARRAVADERRL